MSKMGARELRLHASATQRDIAFFRERAREREAAAAKTAALRALRLAKEDAERGARQPAADAAKPKRPARKRRAAAESER
jgi:hypothetical protein